MHSVGSPHLLLIRYTDTYFCDRVNDYFQLIYNHHVGFHTLALWLNRCMIKFKCIYREFYYYRFHAYTSSEYQELRLPCTGMRNKVSLYNTPVDSSLPPHHEYCQQSHSNACVLTLLILYAWHDVYGWLVLSKYLITRRLVLSVGRAVNQPCTS